MNLQESETLRKLQEPFPVGQIKFRAASIDEANQQGFAVPYVPECVVLERLDTVVGLNGWREQCTPNPDGSVTCALSIKIDGQWVTKTATGGPFPAKRPAKGRQLSQEIAFRCAAQRFGIGRYLREIEGQWLDYDLDEYRWIQEPKLPATTPAPARSRGKK